MNLTFDSSAKDRWKFKTLPSFFPSIILVPISHCLKFPALLCRKMYSSSLNHGCVREGIHSCKILETFPRTSFKEDSLSIVLPCQLILSAYRQLHSPALESLGLLLLHTCLLGHGIRVTFYKQQLCDRRLNCRIIWISTTLDKGDRIKKPTS